MAIPDTRRYATLHSIIIGALLIASVLHAKYSNAQQQGREYIDSLLKELPGLKEDTNKARVLYVLGNEYSGINPDEGTMYSTKALELSGKLGWDKGIATAYNILGICAHYKSEFNQALAYWQKAMDIFTRQGDKRGLLKVIGNIGNVYIYQGDYARALQNNFLALKYAEELDDKYSISINLGNIGATYEYLKDYAKALEYNFKALKVNQDINDSAGIAVTLGNIGNLYTDQKKYGESEKFLLSALAYDERLGNTEGIARNMLNLGSNYAVSGDDNIALGYYFKALRRSESAGLKTIQSKALNLIGEALFRIAKDTSGHTSQSRLSPELAKAYALPRGKPALLRTAIDYLNNSIAIAVGLSRLDDLVQNYHTLSEAQQLTGDFKGALRSHQQYMLMKDSVYSAESKIKITNLETQRALDLKDKQIELDRLAVAKKRNERVLFGAGFALLLIVVVIIVRNIRLSTAKELSENKLNAFQARMNPHFIFNSLSSIQSLILNNETESSIDYLSEFSILMRQILDNSGRSKVTLKTEIDMLRSYIELEHLRFDGFTRTITIADNISEEAVEVPGMVVQPFVENAILHGLVSKGDAGRLDITFERDDKHIICTVEDNGVGRERSAEINKKRSRSRQSHGTSIATNRLTLLNDKKRGLVNTVVYIDKMEDGTAAGTKVTIRLPIL